MAEAPERTPRDLPVAIVGGGPTGMSLALALQRVGIRAAVFDARTRGAAGSDKRVLALSHGSRQTLEWLGVWEAIDATAIHTIHVSQQGGFGRTRLTAAEQQLPALGYVVPAASLIAALDQEVERAGIAWHQETHIGNAVPTEHAIEFSAGLQSASAQLIAYAEGSIGDGAGVGQRDYGQRAVVCTAQTREPHRNTAWERFTSTGPLALLPCGKMFSVVFTCPPHAAEELCGLPDDAFLARLQQQFGHRLEFVSVGPRSAFPLVLRYRHHPVDGRQIWLGNAAQTLHPVAGQGFNLALRDVRELARCLKDASDPGNERMLAQYAARRRLDRRGAIGITDTLVRLFSNDNVWLRHLRGAGLAALDLLPPARSFLARRMIFGARAFP